MFHEVKECFLLFFVFFRVLRGEFFYCLARQHPNEAYFYVFITGPPD